MHSWYMQGMQSVATCACAAEALAQAQQAPSASPRAATARAQHQPRRRMLGQMLCRLTVLTPT